jgi:hypothetical protein
MTLNFSMSPTSVLNVLNARITEFHYLVAIRADQVVVLAIAVRFFVLRQVSAKLVFGH